MALILVVLGIVIIIGKGDKLIAGCNTMSKRRRGMYHVRRIRIVVAGMLWVCVKSSTFGFSVCFVGFC